jgi:hypothetical protein
MRRLLLPAAVALLMVGACDLSKRAPGTCLSDNECSPIQRCQLESPMKYTCVARDGDGGVDNKPECLTDLECRSATAPICDTTAHACVKCSSDGQCQSKDATKPACEIVSGTCFACVDSKKHCPMTAPICETNACRACKKDAECAQSYGADPGVCDGAGRCATGMDVVYLQYSPGCSPANKGTGTGTAPFCFSADAVAAMSPTVHTIVARGSATPLQPLTLSIATPPILIVGQNSARIGDVSPSNTMPLVSVTTGDVTVRGLEISGGFGVGVSVTGGTLHMARCLVLNNADGGIKTMGAPFDITNSVIAGNMGSTAVSLGTYSGAGPTRFAFNTVVANVGIGVFCAQAYPLAGLLVNGNQVSNLGPMCTTDATTSTDPPQFDSSRPYHLTATSPCHDKAGTANVPPDDIDGDARPQGSMADCGADEYVP